MQVSWIDSNHLKGLLERLGDSVPQAKPGSQTWETHTMPESQVDATVPPSLQQEAKEEARVTEVAAEAEVGQWAAATTIADEHAKSLAESGTGEESEDRESSSPEEVAPEVARIRDRLKEVRERAEAAGLLKKAVPAVTVPMVQAAVTLSAPEVSPKPLPVTVVTEPDGETAADDETYFEVPVGSVVERLEAFAQWAQRRVRPGELVLLDEHGDVLWGAQAKGALILSAMMAANALSRATAAGACQEGVKVIRQALSGGGELAVLSCMTQAGLVHLAVEHPGRVGDAAMQLMGQALVSAISACA